MKKALMKKLILLLLFIPLVCFGQTKSLEDQREFEKVKNERFSKVIERLKDVRVAQLAYKNFNGKYSNSFEDLINFIEKFKYPIIQKRDSTYLEYDSNYGIDMIRELVVIDTLGYKSIKDSLFPKSDSYKDMAFIPVNGVNKKFKLKATIINFQNYSNVPVFEVKASKKIILFDQRKDLVEYEMFPLPPCEPCGPDITLGSLSVPSERGNWEY